MKKYTYHVSHSYTTKDGEKVSFITQLYQIGIYGIVNGDAFMQGNFTPANIVSLEKNLKKQQEAKEITDLVFGKSITVSDKTGFWEKL